MQLPVVDNNIVQFHFPNLIFDNSFVPEHVIEEYQKEIKTFCKYVQNKKNWKYLQGIIQLN